jgi:hypothetical protein
VQFILVYIPKLHKNVLLVGTSIDKGFVIMYIGSACYLRSHDNIGKMVLTNTRINILYQLDVNVDLLRSQDHMIVSKKLKPKVQKIGTSTTWASS